jgi:hypothetical protein
MLLDFGVGLVMAAVLSHIWLNFIRFIDYMLDYGSIFWKVRFDYVYRNSSEETKVFLNEQLEFAEDNEDAVSIMNTAYIYAYKQNFKIKRFICLMCLTIYSSLFINFVVLMHLIYFNMYYSIPSYMIGFYAYLWSWNKNDY